MTLNLTPDPRLREFSGLGVVLPGALLSTFVAGPSTTPLATYADGNGITLNSNPVVADAGGLFGPIFLQLGRSYYFKLTASGTVALMGCTKWNQILRINCWQVPSSFLSMGAKKRQPVCSYDVVSPSLILRHYLRCLEKER